MTVRDHGPGLPTDDPDALFERFWRAEGGRERGKGGAGLGLAIVAGIVDAHRRPRARAQRRGRRRGVRRRAARSQEPLSKLPGSSTRRGPSLGHDLARRPPPPARRRGSLDVEIVVPVFNEEAALERSVLRLHRFLSEASRSAGGS